MQILPRTSDRRDEESYRRELSSPLFDLRAQVVDVCEVDAGDDDRREAVTSWFFTDEVLQTVVIILDVRTVTRLSHTHTHLMRYCKTNNRAKTLVNNR